MNWKKYIIIPVIFVSLVLSYIVFVHDIEINPDRQNYINYVIYIVDGGTAPIEPIWYFIIYFINFFSSAEFVHNLFIIVVALASILLKLMIFDKYGGSLVGCMTMYLSYYFLVYDIVQIRIGLAVCFLYLSWFRLKEQKFNTFLLYGLMATLSHLSCLIFITGLVFVSKSQSSWGEWIKRLLYLTPFAAASIFYPYYLVDSISFFANTLEIGKLIEYLGNFENDGFTRISYIRVLPYLLLLLIFLVGFKHWKHDINIILLVRILILGVFIFLILSPVPVFAYRISDMYLFSSILLVGNACKLFKKSTYYIFVSLFTFPILIYTLMFSGLFEYE